MSKIEDPTQLDLEELVALDQIAWQIADRTFSQRGEKSSDMEETVDGYIDQFLFVRRRLIETFVADQGIDPNSY